MKFHRKAREGQITYWREHGPYFADAQNPYFKFRLPPGELFGELIRVAGRDVEVRTLVAQAEGDPTFHVYRPFATRDEVLPFVVSERSYRDVLRNPHPSTIIDETALVVEQEISPAGVAAILSRPFRDVTDIVFAEGASGSKCFCPTTTQDAGIVARNYQGGFLSSRTCVACHRTAGVEGRLLDPNPTPDKYGAIRGGAGVFSAPFVEWVRNGRAVQAR
jgi:hypothetical protein